MSHGPWVSAAAPRRGLIRWRCESCGSVVDFHDDVKSGKPVSGVDRPPDDIDSFLDRCLVDDKQKLLAVLVDGVALATDLPWKERAQKVITTATREVAAEASEAVVPRIGGLK